MSRKKYVIGNWKMHNDIEHASIFLHRLEDKLKKVPKSVEAVICPPNISLHQMKLHIKGGYKLGIQNIYYQDEGAFTGEVSAAMVRDLVDYAIVGHSERRMIFGEKDEIALKISACLRTGIRPILCVGETLMDRQNQETSLVLHDQLQADLAMIDAEDAKKLIIAYEPIWAIGSGDNAKPSQVLRAVRTIRSNLAERYGRDVAEQVPVLYGGSIKPDLFKAYLEVEGVDGGLIGGASLNYQQFAKLITIADKEA
jgi:triosephosphate isomerase